MNSFKIVHCARCGTDIKIPSLTKEEKKELSVIKKDLGELSAIEKVRTSTELNLKDAKALVIHMNKPGHCNRCNYASFQGENVICPKCKSFNLNWESDNFEI